MAVARAIGLALLTVLAIVGLASRYLWALRPIPMGSLTGRLLTAAILIVLIFAAVLVVDVIGH